MSLANKIHWDWNALHTAVMSDSPDIVDLLLKSGSDAEVKDGAGRNAKELAEEYRKEGVLGYFRRNK